MGGDEAEEGLRRGVDPARAAIWRQLVTAMSWRDLYCEAGAGERVVGVTREGGPAVALEGRGIRRPRRQVQVAESGCGEVHVIQGEEEGGGHGIQPDGS
jgi:hypothetical protein